MRVFQALPKGAQKVLKERLLPKERVLVALPGLAIYRSGKRFIYPVYFGVFRPVLLIVTNKRVIVMAKGWLRTIYYGWQMNQLAGAHFGPGRLFDGVALKVGDRVTHVLFLKRLRTATKQFVTQLWHVISAGKQKRRKRKSA